MESLQHGSKYVGGERIGVDDPSEALVSVFFEFLRLRPRLKSMLPAEMVHARNQLEAMGEAGHANRAADVDLYYRLGGALDRLGIPTMTELSEALSVPQSTATRLVDVLVARGYAHRMPDPADRRVVRVSLSAAGREMYQKIDGYVRTRVTHALSLLSPEEQHTLVLLLRKVLNGLRQHST